MKGNILKRLISKIVIATLFISSYINADVFKFFHSTKSNEVKVDVYKLLANPKVYLHKTIIIEAQYKGKGKNFIRFYSKYEPSSYINIHLWPKNAKLWNPDERKKFLACVYIPLHREDLNWEVIKNLKRYQIIKIQAYVSMVLKGEPFLEVRSLEKIDTEYFSEKSLKFIKNALDRLENHQYDLALLNFKAAFKYGVPPFCKTFIYEKCGDIYHIKKENRKSYEYYIKALKYKKDKNNQHLLEKILLIGIENYDISILEEFSNRILDSFPESSIAHIGNSILYYHNHEFNKALQEISIALQINPKEAIAYYWKAKILENLNKDNKEEIVKCLKKAVELAPQSIEYREKLAYFLQQEKSYQEAIYHYQTLLSFGKKKSQYYCNLGICHLKIGNIGLAVKNLQQSLECDKNNILATQTLADIYFNHKEYSQALELYERISSEKRGWKIWYRLGIIYWQFKKEKKALSCLKKALQFKNAPDEVLYVLALLEYSMKKISSAFDHFQLLISRMPNNYKIRYDFALMAMEQKKYKLAEEQFSVLKNIAGYKVKSTLNLASIYLEKKEFNKAKEFYKEVLKLDPNHSLAYNNLAYLYLTTPPYDIDKGMELAKRAYALSPTSKAILDTLGWAYYLKGEYKKALGYLENAKDNNAEVLYHLGMCYYKLKKFSKAYEIFKHIKSSFPLYSEYKEKILEMIKSIEKEIHNSQQPASTQKEPPKISLPKVQKEKENQKEEMFHKKKSR